MPEVDVPGVGRVERKYVWYGLGAVGVIAAWYWWRSRSSSSTSSTVDPNAIDPMTGLPFSAEQNGNTPFVNPNPVQAVINGVGGNGITTNQEWVADVTEKLGNIGVDPSFLSAVLGKYLASQPLTSDEADIVRRAWAYSGKPPQGPNNIILATTASTPGTPTPGGSNNGKSPVVTPAPATWHPPATQKYGSVGDLVRQIQVALKAYGFDPGPADGHYGPRTLAAVKAFQRSRHLTPDGIVGPLTWKALHG